MQSTLEESEFLKAMVTVPGFKFQLRLPLLSSSRAAIIDNNWTTILARVAGVVCQSTLSRRIPSIVFLPRIFRPTVLLKVEDDQGTSQPFSYTSPQFSRLS